MSNPFGRHLIAELYKCNSELLDNLPQLERIMVHAALLAGAEVREVVFHKFQPQGVSGVIIISESHLAIHTFPEFSYAAVDIYTCGHRLNPNDAYCYIANQLQASCTLVKEIPRGFAAS